MSDLGDALEKIDMEWLLSREGVTYRESYGRSGRQLNAKTCPFCHTSEYKVYINADSGVGNCFSGSCPQKTFNKWTFMKGLFELEGRNLVNLIQDLAREQGWRPNVNTGSVGLQDINTLDLPDPVERVWEMDELPEYLARRGVTRDLAEHFSLHWSESGVWRFMDPRGFEGKQDYSNRIILPILDTDADLVSFQGRDTTGTAEQRYLFPPGFASAGAYLYNAVNVREGTKTVVISEGVFDVIQVKRSLAMNPKTEHIAPIGTFGMHLSSGNPTGNDQLGRLRKLREERGLEEVIFLWDGERKAAAEAIRCGLECMRIGIKVKIGLVPDGKDPGNSNPIQIQDAVLNAMPLRTKIDAIRIAKAVKDSYKTP